MRGPRELAFFPGTAAGPVYGGFRYETEDGAHAAHVAFQPPQLASAVESVEGDAHVIGDRAEQGTPSGAAPAQQGDSILAAGSAESVTETAENSGRQEGTHSPCMSAREPQAGWLVCRDYTNGGPQFVPFAVIERKGQLAGPSGQVSDVECNHGVYECLAVYPDKGSGLAAVRCPVGAGVAVLVGTHPELDPNWLATDSDKVSAVAEELKPHAAGGQPSHSHGLLRASGEGVRDQLERCRAERGMFWRMLLQAAGMGRFLLDTPPQTPHWK